MTANRPQPFRRTRRNGRVEPGVPLMSLPAYTRARALAVRLRETMPEEDFQSLCLYNAESNAILKALEDAGDDSDLSGIQLFPCVVPERGASDRTMQSALSVLHDLLEQDHPSEKEPWWKFWS